MSIGYHVERRGDLCKSLEAAIYKMRSLGFDNLIFQIFVVGPRNYKLLLHDTEPLRLLIMNHRVNVVFHGAYIDAPWTHKIPNMMNIVRELKLSDKVGANGTIVHLSNHTNDKICDVLKYINSKYRGGSTIWLEINAVRASENSYETPAKINRLFDAIARCDVGLNVGLCIDTAHLFSCGVSFADPSVVNEWFSQLDKSIKIMVHLNDSSAILGRGKDIHAELCGGNIWAADHSGLVALLNHIDRSNVPTILERNNDYIDNDLLFLQYLGYFQ